MVVNSHEKSQGLKSNNPQSNCFILILLRLGGMVPSKWATAFILLVPNSVVSVFPSYPEPYAFAVAIQDSLK